MNIIMCCSTVVLHCAAVVVVGVLIVLTYFTFCSAKQQHCSTAAQQHQKIF